METRIETRRLILRPFEPSDALAAFGWFGDPVVMRFSPTGPDKSGEETKTRLASYAKHQLVHGFSKWLIFLLVLINSAEVNARVYNTLVMKTNARNKKNGQLAFDIFTTSPSGSARRIESVENLAAARKRLKEIARSATGDCFIYSKENGIVELFVKSETKNPPLTMSSFHIIRGKLAS